jgi:glucosamine-6-phosphate deaminase
MLDEYLDLPTYPRRSFVEYLQTHLGELVFNATTTRHTMVPDESDAFTSSYDRALDDVGGIDLAIVGVGRNGHVGFNEPGTRVSLRTHAVALSNDTLNDNFGGVSDDERPTRAMTIGMRDLLDARTVLMLISGRAKRDVTSLLIDECVDESVPATQLLNHANLHVLVTSDTVAGLVSA